MQKPHLGRGSGQGPLSLPLLSLSGLQAWSLGLAPLLSHSEGPKDPVSALSPPRQSLPLPPRASHSGPPCPLADCPHPDRTPGKRPKLAGAQREPLGIGSLSPRGRLSPNPPALHLLSKFNRVTGEPSPKLGVQVGGRGNLDHFLVPPLDGTVSLIQVQNVPILVSYSERETQLLQGLKHFLNTHQTPYNCWG